jgi:Ni/Co efflux regulator RcnB
MKRMLAVSAALAVLVPLASADAATVVKEKRHKVVVKHVPGHPGAVMVRPNERRPHHFWHRGAWTVRIHGPRFVYPHGWGHRRWVVGAVLPALFLTSAYYYDDYAAAGLQAPAPGYRWVRYGDDLLLVNIRTGEVEDVAEDVFE